MHLSIETKKVWPYRFDHPARQVEIRCNAWSLRLCLDMVSAGTAAHHVMWIRRGVPTLYENRRWPEGRFGRFIYRRTFTTKEPTP